MAGRPRRRFIRLALVLALAIVLGTVQSVQNPPAAHASPTLLIHCYLVWVGPGRFELRCEAVRLPEQINPRWRDECPECLPTIALTRLRDDIVNPVHDYLLRGAALWSQAANSTNPAALRDQALDVYTQAARLLGQTPLRLDAYGLADQRTGRLYAASPTYPAPWEPEPTPWDPDPNPWYWPQLTLDAVSDLQVGVANPGQLARQRSLAATPLDLAYQDLLTVLTR